MRWVADCRSIGTGLGMGLTLGQGSLVRRQCKLASRTYDQAWKMGIRDVVCVSGRFSREAVGSIQLS